jgi:superfamily I DNA/RNA helicase
MKFYIHDRCLERMLELPKATSKKILEFQRKFRENPHNAAINLESIHEFKDKKLRTARIDLKYRAIIATSTKGDAFYMLWVDNHDEAMDWAKSKVFEWNESTSSVQIFTSPLSITLPGQAAPKSDKGLFKKYSESDLQQIGVPDKLQVVVRSIADLDELGNIEKDLPPDAFENLFKLADGVDIKTLIQEVEEGRNISPGETLSDNDKRFYVEVSDKLMEDAINGDFDKWQVFLHPTQRRLVESSFKGSAKVTGGAGTGKTVVALHRIKHLSDKYPSSREKRIVFTTYTNQLTEHLEALAKRIDIDLSRVMVTNIDSLVRELAKKYRIMDDASRVLDQGTTLKSKDVWQKILSVKSTVFDADFLHREYQDVVLYNAINEQAEYLIVARTGRDTPLTRRQRIEVWMLFEAYMAYKKEQRLFDRAELFNKVRAHILTLGRRPFDHVVADEVQDLSNIEIRFLRSLAEEGADDIFLVGDPYQRIYARRVNFSASGISVRGNRSKQLKINYRTSEEIKRTAVKTVQSLSLDDFDGVNESLKGYLSIFHGELPTYDIYKTKNEEVNALMSAIQLLHDSGVSYAAMAVGVRLRQSIGPFRDAMHKAGLPFYDRIDGKLRTRGGILLSTLHGLKGLEFRAVFLVDVTDRSCPLVIPNFESLSSVERTEYLNSERSLMYVAMSRAVKVLKISGTGIKSEMVRV